MEALWASIASVMATLLFIKSLGDFLPHYVYDFLHEICVRFLGFLSPYVTMKIEETESDGFRQSELFWAAHQYLSEMSSSDARTLVLRKPRNSRDFSFSADKNERLVDEFQDAQICWVLRTKQRSAKFLWWDESEERCFYEIKFHRRHKRLVVEKYLQHILEEAKAAE